MSKKRRVQAADLARQERVELAEWPKEFVCPSCQVAEDAPEGIRDHGEALLACAGCGTVTTFTWPTPKEEQVNSAQFAFDQQMPGLSESQLEMWINLYEWRLGRLRAERMRRGLRVVRA